MEFGETIRRRRMVRRYRDDAVDPAAVDRILDAALTAPTAGHSQGRSFVVVTDVSLRHRIAEAAGEAGYVADGFDPWLSVAPVHVVLVGEPQRYSERYAEPDKGVEDLSTHWPVPYWWVDVGAALMAMLLAAVDEGLVAGFLGGHAVPGLGGIVGLPEEAVAVGVVTIGHPAPDRRSGSLDRGRRPRTETVHRERWGSAPGEGDAPP